MHVLTITFPVFLLIFLGYLLRRQKILSADSVQIINSFVYRVSLPAIIFFAFWGIDWTRADVRQAVVFNLFVILGAAIFFLFSGSVFRFNPQNKAALFMGALVGNTIYMGFPIGEQAFGPEIYPLFLAAATPHLSLGIFFSELAIEHLLHKRKPLKEYLLSAIKNPIFISLGAGIALSFAPSGIALLESLRRAGSLVAATASPLALIALGAFLYHHVRPIKHFVEVATIVLKILVFPAAILGLGFLMPNLDKSIIAVSAIVAAMPTAVSMFTVAEQHKISPQSVANVILWGTVVSMITINVLLSLLV